MSQVIRHWKVHSLGSLLLVLWWAGLTPLQAQRVETLIDFTSTWRYDESGRELGTGWKAAGYFPDTIWQTGAGLLGMDYGVPDPYRQHAPVNTTLFMSNPMIVTNYYFRTIFTFSGSVNGVTLIASNIIDDGAVIYLNGTEVGRFRVPPNQNSAMYATGSAPEGSLETIVLPKQPLRQGLNVIAAEVRQAANSGLDIMWGMKLVAIRDEPLTIVTNLSNHLATAVQEALTLEIGITGGPAEYSWFKDGLIVGSNRLYRIDPVTAESDGNYWVVVTNSISAVTSVVAHVTVEPDILGPEVIRAIGNGAENGTGPYIELVFNEPLHPDAVGAHPETFLAYAGDDFSRPIQITNVTTLSTEPPRLGLWVTGPNWEEHSSCFVFIPGGLPDQNGTNFINPNTVIPVAWASPTNLIRVSDEWSYYARASEDTSFPRVYSEFFQPDYRPEQHAGWAGPANGSFHTTNITPNCGFTTLGTTIQSQAHPTVFRREFVAHPLSTTRYAPCAITVTLRLLAADAVLLYLNGTEIYRWNVEGTAPLHLNTVPLTEPSSSCAETTLILTNLFKPGTNVMAAAVVHGSQAGNDVQFGLELDAAWWQTSSVPSPSAVRHLDQFVSTVGTGATPLILSWPSNLYGAKLQFAPSVGESTVWRQVRDQSNPHTNTLANGDATEHRFFRLQLAP